MLLVAFSSFWGFGGKVQSAFLACAFFFFGLSWDQIAHTIFLSYDRISPQWLSELRRLWPSVSWWVACELISLIGSHTMPGQHSQPTRTLLHEGCICAEIWPATCTFGRMTGIFCVSLGQHEWNRHRTRVSTERSLGRRKFSHSSCRDSNLQPFDNESCAPPTSWPGSCNVTFFLLELCKEQKE